MKGRASMRRLGAPALALALVACGPADDGGEFYTRWDLAGGCTSTLEGAARADAFGEPVDVCDYAGPGWVWVTYAAGWCSASRSQAPHVQRFARRASRPVQVFTVLTGGPEFGVPPTRDDARRWASAHGIEGGRVLYESDDGGRTIPQHLLIGPDGRTWYRYVGFLDAEAMQALVEEFADGRREPDVRDLPVR